MASEQDVIVALEVSAKVGGKALLLDLCKDGGAIDLQMGLLGPFAVMLSPMVKQVISAIASKLA